jgi:hypothetical protein
MSQFPRLIYAPDCVNVHGQGPDKYKEVGDVAELERHLEQGWNLEQPELGPVPVEPERKSAGLASNMREELERLRKAFDKRGVTIQGLLDESNLLRAELAMRSKSNLEALAEARSVPVPTVTDAENAALQDALDSYDAPISIDDDLQPVGSGPDTPETKSDTQQMAKRGPGRPRKDSTAASA